MKPTSWPLVAVVDPDKNLRESLRTRLKPHRFKVVGFGTAREFLDALPTQAFSAAVLELRLPDQGGLEVQKLLAERRVPVPVVFLTAHATVSAAIDAMHSGALDLLEKPAKERELAEAVRHAVALHDSRLRDLTDRREARERIARLTPRELQVLDLMAQGKKNKHIAEELGISVKTLDIHRNKVKYKLGAKNTAQLARLRMLDRTEPRGLAFLR